MFNVKILETDNIEELMKLFIDCFYDDHTYKSNYFPNDETRRDDMYKSFKEPIYGIISLGYSFGLWEGNRLVGFTLGFDYKNLLRTNKNMFINIFVLNASEFEALPYYKEFHSRIVAVDSEVMYMMSIAIDPAYRRRGLASMMLDNLLKTYNSYTLVSDVSNTNSLQMYRKRNFDISEIEDDYFFVIKYA